MTRDYRCHSDATGPRIVRLRIVLIGFRSGRSLSADWGDGAPIGVIAAGALILYAGLGLSLTATTTVTALPVMEMDEAGPSGILEMSYRGLTLVEFAQAIGLDPTDPLAARMFMDLCLAEEQEESRQRQIAK